MLTTHVWTAYAADLAAGQALHADYACVDSLPRSPDVVDLLWAQDRGNPYDAEAFDATMRRAVADAVSKRAAAGDHVVGDGAMIKISYATYVAGHRTVAYSCPRSPKTVIRSEAFLNRLF